ncbi:MAG TPA: chromate transporter, partial [Candidatus Udaeobacter sp.]|nr:chromate transporter [Candidatus Udaeobacter sp.]
VPSAVLVVLLTWGFTSLSGSAAALATLAAILAAAVGMMWAAAWLLVKPQLRSPMTLRTILLVAGGFVALSKWSVPPLQVLAAAALIGFFWSCGDDP